MTVRSSWYTMTAVGLALVSLTAAGCSTKSGADASPGTPGRVVEPKDAATVRLALVTSAAYFGPWQATAEQTKADFKLGEVTVDASGEGNQGEQKRVIETLAARGYNAFGITGVSPSGINSTFEELKAQGVATGSLAACPAGDTNSADFCLATDVEASAYKAAKATIDAIGGEGTIVHLTGKDADYITQRRIAGVKKAVDETNGKVTELPVITDLDKDLPTAEKAVSDLLASKGQEIKGIVTTAADPAAAAAEAVATAQLPIKVVAIDDDAEIMAGIRSGQVTATVVQNPIGQAYIGGWLLALLGSKQCALKTPGLIVDSGSFVVTKDNVDKYDEERKVKTRDLQTELTNQLTCQ